MFQYAHGLSLARQHYMSLALDFVCEPCWTTRRFELDRLRISADLADRRVTQRFKVQPGPLTRIAERLLPSQWRSMSLRPQVLREQGFPVQPVAVDSSRDAYLIGYWQSELYFRTLADDLRLEFQPVRPASDAVRRILDAISTFDSVSVHVRRGDYVTSQSASAHHGVLDLEYYRSAVARLEQEHPGAHYFVFTDDPSWVRVNFALGVAFSVVDANGSAPEWDLYLMSLCRRHIIANSSFSWWGAWLDSRRDKVVIAPKRWFAAPDAPDVCDLLPKDWIRL